jgi:GAF domain-containing protein
MFGVTSELAAFLLQGVNPGPDAPMGRIMQGERLIEVLDLAEDEGYRVGDPVARAAVELGSSRSMIFVALVREETLLGGFGIARREARPFTDKQIALLRDFASQAVIAMENARLITETREALEQQTATAEVLQAINASPGNLTPVFDVILEKTHNLCGATKGAFVVSDGAHFHLAATRGLCEAYLRVLKERSRMPHNASSPRGQLLNGASLVRLTASAASPNPTARAAAELEEIHTAVFIPLRRDRQLLGYVTAYRQEVDQFSDKQIALMRSFAAQAVIAMENARLITETREALEQQTATAEVLQVINSSPGDLTPVFDAILEKAHRLCGATHGSLTLFDGERFRAVATYGHSEVWAERLREGCPPSIIPELSRCWPAPALSTLPT